MLFICLKVLLWWPPSKCRDRKAKKSRTKISRSLQFRALIPVFLLFQIPCIFEKVNSFITNLGQANLWLARSGRTQTFLITAGVIDLPLGQLAAALHWLCLASSPPNLCQPWQLMGCGLAFLTGFFSLTFRPAEITYRDAKWKYVFQQVCGFVF